MAFEYEIDDIVKQFNIRKDKVKDRIKKFAYEEGVDYQTMLCHSKGHGGQNKERITLTKTSYDQIVAYYSLTLRKKSVNTSINIDYVKRYLPEEVEILDFVCDVLSLTFTLIRQHRVLQYRIDLYIKEANIAIECDEHNHKDRDAEYEAAREKNIIKEINCKFIRFNPHDTNFQLSQLLALIVKECYTQKKSVT